jgi:hypothetical protein
LLTFIKLLEQQTLNRRGAVLAREDSSRLGVGSGLPPLSLVDMLQATGGSFSYLVVPLPPCGSPLLGCLLA